ncbi:hypothetical protein OJAV_G00235700 [Oryzias javanicus]|uniref:Ig-like domain-containing protein n=1 Tax=Oryzias javanicus TaxID=123683 RepID=A0A3S2LJY4_ORYJA|nr:hypothetical protein OJAV_G00235700 [Oryzias javanicus]
MFRGETITLTCEVQGGEGVQWEYEWRTSQSQTFRTNRKDWTFTASISGDYSCKSRSTHDSYSATEWSEALTLSVSDLKPEAVLRVSPRWLSPGSSVTLSCEVEHESAGWSFYWYKAVPDLSHKSASYSYELLPASSNGTADNSYIIHGQTHTAGYVCRAGRGEPHVSTLYSQPDFVWSGDLHPSASLSVSPDRVPTLHSDSLSLTCEGNSAEWRVGSFLLPDCCHSVLTGETMNGSTCHVQKIQSSNAVFWCESGSAFSNAVNITGHSGSSLFGSHRDPEEIQNDPEDESKGESRKITYSSIKIKEKETEPAEMIVYSDVKTGASADGSQLYAEMMKRNKGKFCPSADEMLYSEIQ